MPAPIDYPIRPVTSLSIPTSHPEPVPYEPTTLHEETEPAMTIDPATERLTPPPIIPGRNVPSTPPPTWPPYVNHGTDWENRPSSVSHHSVNSSDWENRPSSVGHYPSTPAPMQPNETYLAAQHGWSDPGNQEVRRNWTILLVLSVILLAMATVVGLAVQRLNLLPASVPLIGKDSGIAACESIAKGEKMGGRTGEAMTPDQYREIRGVFADSSYRAIRDNGVRMVDLAWQVQGLESTDLVAALTYVAPITEAYTGLAGGCAAVGITIPALGS